MTLSGISGQPTVTDSGTTFHRVYVQGDGDTPPQDSSFEDDLDELKSDLETDANQASDSTSRTFVRPTKRQLMDYLDELKRTAEPGDEVMFYFGGHGGNDRFVDNDGDEGNGFDEHIRINQNERITDDELAEMLSGFRESVTLVVVLDTCYGGGFAGGSSDLQESSHVSVVGTPGTCPIDPWSIFGAFVETLTEAVADKAGMQEADENGDGQVNATELKRGLEGQGWRLGPAEAGEVIKKGHSKCECAQPSISLAPSSGVGGTVTVEGELFAPGANVTLNVTDSSLVTTTVAELRTDTRGTFSRSIELPSVPSLVRAVDEQGHEDWSVFDLPKGTVRGKVIAAGEALPDAVVGLIAAGSIVDQTITDGVGEFVLAIVPPGTYTLTVSKAGYESQTLSADVTGGVVTDIGNVTLTTPSPDEQYAVFLIPAVAIAVIVAIAVLIVPRWYLLGDVIGLGVGLFTLAVIIVNIPLEPFPLVLAAALIVSLMIVHSLGILRKRGRPS